MKQKDGFGSGDWTKALPPDGFEIVAGVVIEAVPGQAPAVAARLGGIDGLELVGEDGDRRIAGVWTAPSGKALVQAAEALLQEEEGIIGIFPTFLGRSDETGVDDATAEARAGLEDEAGA